jgi:hypothetical protein
MREDDVITEVRTIRTQIVAEYGGDLAAMAKDLRRKHGGKTVTLPSRTPEVCPPSAGRA